MKKILFVTLLCLFVLKGITQNELEIKILDSKESFIHVKDSLSKDSLLQFGYVELSYDQLSQDERDFVILSLQSDKFPESIGNKGLQIATVDMTFPAGEVIIKHLDKVYVFSKDFTQDILPSTIFYIIRP